MIDGYNAAIDDTLKFMKWLRLNVNQTLLYN